jgi:hypothetical protein
MPAQDLCLGVSPITQRSGVGALRLLFCVFLS